MSNSTPAAGRAERRPSLRRWLRLRHDRRGVAALEFGMLATLLVPVMLAVLDTGNQVYQTLVLRQAVRAGALYALYYHDTAGIRQTIESSIPSGWSTASVYSDNWAPVTSCICMSTDGTATGSSDCTCPSGSTLERLMTLTVTMPFSPVMVSSVNQISASDVIRYQ